MQYRQALEAIAHLKLKGNESIPDVGCGDGKITAYLAQKVPNGQVVGVDLTQNMVGFASNTFQDVPNLTFQKTSGDQLNFKNSFDCVTSFSCLHWIENQKDVWQGFYQALKK